MNDLRLYELLKKQQQGCLTAAEEILLNQWYHTLKNTAEQPPAMKLMKYRVWTAIRKRLQIKDRQVMLWKKYAVAAAVISIAAVAAWYMKPLQQMRPPQQQAIVMKTIKVPHGKQVRLVLADSSIVWLNGDAELDYPTAFDSARNVYLHYGEAFFEVAQDAHRPFIVHSQDLHTQVLGTSFDIRNLKGQYTVAVATGKVKVYYRSGQKSISISNMLKAGDRLVTDSVASSAFVDHLDGNLYKGWISKSYQLKDVSLPGITFCMESIYGIHIIISNEALKKLRFTTSVGYSDKMEDILRRLSLAGGFHYKTDTPGTVVIY